MTIDIDKINKEITEEFDRLSKVGKKDFFKLSGAETNRFTNATEEHLADVFGLGYARGFKQGEDRARKQIAKSMLGLDYTLGQVMEITDVTMDYIDEQTIKAMNLAKKGKK